ncbi:MAG: InlB B-repeat-containing protein [Lachnospiraceae bacterium]|nr:InlB B-repeat-containing protein [Lachnospiraceae bacterium]
MKHRGKGQLNNKGITLVELVVSFALLAIFLGAASMCISHAVIFYYNERESMAAYSVADLAFSEIKDELATMQGSEFNGYVKIRTKASGSDQVVAVAENGGVYKGSTIEFVASNIADGDNAVLLDTNGLPSGAVMIDDEKVVNTDLKHINKDHLTLRYYRKFPKEDLAGYEKLYMNNVVLGSKASKLTAFNGITGKNVVWHAEEKLPDAAYQDLKIGLEFSVKPKADDFGNAVVSAVDVTVKVLDENDAIVYTKERRVELQNTVYYRTENTLYTDGAIIHYNPDPVSYWVKYVDTEGNLISQVKKTGLEGDTVVADSLKLAIEGFTYYGNSGNVTLSKDQGTTITLTYVRKRFSISYYYNSLNVSTNDNPEEYAYGDDSLGDIKELGVKDGYTFKGWYYDEGYEHKITKFSEHPDLNKGNIALYAFIEKQKTHDDSRIDNLDNDDSGREFTNDFDTPDKLTVTGYSPDNIIYSLNGYNENYNCIKELLAAALLPHDFSLDDIFVSSHVYTPSSENKRHTRLYLFQKAAMKTMGINASSSGEQIVEAILKYLDSEDMTQSENLTVELPADCVAVYESLHNWSNSSEADTKWVKLDNPEPIVYLHLKFGRYRENGNGKWIYTHYTIWMNEVE